MTASDWRKRVDDGIGFLIRPLQERAERAEAELARLRGQEPVAWCDGSNLHVGCDLRFPAFSDRREHTDTPLYAEPMPSKESK